MVDLREDFLDEIQAGNAFRESIKPRANQWAASAPLWHGWAIMEAFRAGAAWQRAQTNVREEAKAQARLTAFVDGIKGVNFVPDECPISTRPEIDDRRLTVGDLRVLARAKGD